MGNIKRRVPNPKDLAQLMRFKAPVLNAKTRRLNDALTIYDLRDIAKRRTPQAPKAHATAATPPAHPRNPQ